MPLLPDLLVAAAEKPSEAFELPKPWMRPYSRQCIINVHPRDCIIICPGKWERYKPGLTCMEEVLVDE